MNWNTAGLRIKKVEVVVEGKSTDGKVIRETAGEKGGDTITIKMDGVSDPASLKKNGRGAAQDKKATQDTAVALPAG